MARYKGRRRGGIHNFSPWAIASGWKMKPRGPGSNTQTTRRRRNNDSGVTQQHDIARQYRYKRMPRRMRRRFKKRYRMFRNRLLKELGTQQIIRNSNISITALPSAQQWGAVHLYGFAGTENVQEIGNSDMDAIYANDPALTDSGKVFFQNAIVDITVRNNATQVLELDQYILLARPTNRIFPGIQAALLNAAGDTPIIGGGSSIAMTTRGATPFEFGDFCKYFKVLNKTKFFVGGGQCITYQYKDRRDRMITGDEFNRTPVLETANCYKDGWTKVIFYVGKAVTGSTESANFSVGATRSYRYKYLEDNTNRDAVI